MLNCSGCWCVGMHALGFQHGLEALHWPLAVGCSLIFFLWKMLQQASIQDPLTSASLLTEQGLGLKPNGAAGS